MRIALLLIFIACASPKKDTGLGTVEIENNKDNQYKISEQNNSVYGPTFGENNPTEANTQELKKKETISLTVYSTMYTSLALVDYFKKLEKENIEITSINTSGFASVVSALYAKDKSTSYLEWKLFALLKKLKSETPYSKGWRQTIYSFLKDEFKSTQLQQLKITLTIPELNNGELVWRKSGKLIDIINNSLNLKNKSNFLVKPKNIIQEVENMGGDLNFHVAFMPKNVQIKKIDGYTWGIFSNYLSYILKNKDMISILYADAHNNIDEIYPLSEIQDNFKESVKIELEQYQEKIKSWKEENSTSSI